MIAFAWAMLVIWPIVALNLFRKYSLPVAVLTTILGGYLLLPGRVGVDLPVLPPLNKVTIPTLMAFGLALIALHKNPQAGSAVPGWLPRNPVTLLLLAMVFVGILGTVATNRDTLVYGWRVLPALSLYDGFSMMMELGIFFLPILLGRKLMATQEGQRTLLMVFAIAAIAYSFPALYEIRMSPQLNMTVYGFFGHQFLQHMRNDGFRPIVFLEHGLSLSIFLTFSVIAAVGLMRSARPDDKLKWMVAMVWLFAVLVLSKSLGATLIAMLLVPVALFLPPRLQLMIAAGIAVVVLIYPILRAAQVIPIRWFLEIVESFNPARAQSLGSRFEHEELLIGKALERPLLGWGIWGRQRAFDEFGNNLSVTDGSWIIDFGVGGWVRYIGIYGLFCWPIIGLFLARRNKVDIVCTTLALILSAKLVDLIPNAGVQGYLMLLIGSLLGRLEMRQGTQDTAHEDATQGQMRPGYARQFSDKVEEHERNDPVDSDNGHSRPLPSYKRSFPGAGYRK